MNPIKKERIEQFNFILTAREFKSINDVSIRFLNSEESGEGIKGDLLVNGYEKGLYIVGFREQLELALFSNNNFKINSTANNLKGLNVVMINGIDMAAIIEIFTTKMYFLDNPNIRFHAN